MPTTRKQRERELRAAPDRTGDCGAHIHPKVTVFYPGAPLCYTAPPERFVVAHHALLGYDSVQSKVSRPTSRGLKRPGKRIESSHIRERFGLVPPTGKPSRVCEAAAERGALPARGIRVTSSAVVLGAGLQGVCAALALRRKGYAVALVDQAATAMTRASLNNEGKIHLGLVYPKDSTDRTAHLMLRSALRFAPLLEKFCAAPFEWEGLRARPFTNLVLNDSMLTPEQIESSYVRLEERYREEMKEPGLHYLGLRPERLFRMAGRPEPGGFLNPDRVAATIETAEIPLAVPRFRKQLNACLEHTEGIERLFCHRVESLERTSSGFRVSGRGPESAAWQREADLVVNCLWEGRLRLDEQLGLLPRRRWVYRLKMRLFGDLPEHLEALPSLTMVVGPYGDIVVDPPSPAYLSWYPAGLRGWSHEVSPPAEWEEMCSKPWGLKGYEAMARETIEGFRDVVCGIGETRPLDVRGGVIFSWGETDIDDPDSELHVRHEIGVESHDGYFTINTGKLTCAPLFAEELVRQLEGVRSCA